MDETDDFAICEICKREYNQEKIVGCCANECYEIMCNKCATWIEDDEEWLCPKCN